MKTRHNRNTEAAGQQTTRSRGANPGRGVRPSGINRNSAVRSLSPAPRHLFASCCNVGYIYIIIIYISGCNPVQKQSTTTK